MANMVVMRHDKVKSKAALTGLQNENNRTAKEYNNSVDLERSKDNVWLVRCNNYVDDVMETIRQADVKTKHDSTLAISSVYTASPDWFKQHLQSTHMDYFNDCLEFHRQRYGKVISAVVHFDETTPHMHVVSVPIVRVQAKENYYVNTQTGKEIKANSDEYQRLKNEKDEHGKKIIQRKQRKLKDEHGKPIYRTALNAAEALGHRKQMSQAQTDIVNQVGKKYGLERGAIRVDTQERKEHLTAQQYRQQELERTRAIAQETIKKMKVQAQGLKVERQELKNDIERQSERVSVAEKMATEKETEAEKRIAAADREAQQAERNAALQHQKIQEQGQRLIDHYKTKIKSLKKQESELQTDLHAKEAWINDYNQMLKNPGSDDYKIYIEYRKQVESGRIDERMEKAFEAAFKGDGLVSIDDWVK